MYIRYLLCLKGILGGACSEMNAYYMMNSHYLYKAMYIKVPLYVHYK